MKRTQIYLDEEIFEFLVSESRNKHKTMSDIIRESIKDKIRNNNKNLLKYLNKVAGIWKNNEFNVDNYINNIRKDRLI
ncbi:MAG: hypothetical protein JXB50_05170 [Spirochaetes bacterium]|nr:hypothetical protein [Spirochaetota bacterium]